MVAHTVLISSRLSVYRFLVTKCPSCPLAGGWTVSCPDSHEVSDEVISLSRGVCLITGKEERGRKEGENPFHR